MRLLRRRKDDDDAMAMWRAGTSAVEPRPAARAVPRRGSLLYRLTGRPAFAPAPEDAVETDGFVHAADVGPDDVVWTGRTSMEGGHVAGNRGSITGLEGGGSGHWPGPHVGS